MPELRCARVSNTSMNVAPMILRFFSGSVTPASRSRNRSRRVDEHRAAGCSRSKRVADLRRFVQPQQAVVDEDAGQPIADRPVHQQRRDRRVDAAATGRRRRARRRPARGSAPTLSSTNDAIVQSPVQPQTPNAKLRRISMPLLGVRDFGMEQQPVELPRRTLPSPRPARWPTSRRPRSPGGAAATKSPWLAQTRSSRRHRREQRRAVGSIVTSRVPELAVRRRRHLRRRARASSAACRSRCRASACRARSTPGSQCGAPGSETLFGPPDRMMPDRLPRARSLAAACRAAGSPSRPTARAAGARSAACTASRNRERRSSDVSR